MLAPLPLTSSHWFRTLRRKDAKKKNNEKGSNIWGMWNVWGTVVVVVEATEKQRNTMSTTDKTRKKRIKRTYPTKFGDTTKWGERNIDSTCPSLQWRYWRLLPPGNVWINVHWRKHHCFVANVVPWKFPTTTMEIQSISMPPNKEQRRFRHHILSTTSREQRSKSKGDSVLEH